MGQGRLRQRWLLRGSQPLGWLGRARSSMLEQPGAGDCGSSVVKPEEVGSLACPLTLHKLHSLSDCWKDCIGRILVMGNEGIYQCTGFLRIPLAI